MLNNRVYTIIVLQDKIGTGNYCIIKFGLKQLSK